MLMLFFLGGGGVFNVQSRWKRNAENRTKFFGKGSGRGKKGVCGRETSPSQNVGKNFNE